MLSQLVTFFGVSTRTIRRTLDSKLVKSLNGKPPKYTLYGNITKNADENGLWKYSGYTFSIYRTLNRTIFHLVTKSRAGLSANDLSEMLDRDVWRDVWPLLRRGWISCVKIGHTKYYFAQEFTKAQRQLIARYNEHQGYQLQLKGELREIIFSKAGMVLRDRIQQVCRRKQLSLTPREIDIIVSALLRPLLRAGRSDKDLSRYLTTNPELTGFFSFIKRTIPTRSEINAVENKLDGAALTAIFNALVVWIIEQLKLEKISVAIDGSHGYQSRGNKRGIKIHTACITELGFPIGFVFLEDGMEYDLNSLITLLKQIRALNVKVEYVIADALYNVPEFYYEVAMILEAEGISCNSKYRLLGDTSPVDDDIVRFFNKRNDSHLNAIASNSLKRRGRPRDVPDHKVSFDDKRLIGELLRNYPLTSWGSEKRKEVYKKRTIVERLFSILKLWLDLDGMRTKPNARRWNIYASFISLLTLSILAIITGISSLLLKVRKFVL